MGGGDLKLAAGIGAAVGYAGGITIIFYSSLLALVYIVIVKFIRKEIGGFIRDSLFSIKTFGQVKYEMPVKADEIMKATVPLGAFFLPGALFYLLKGGF
jgi:prepilin signal peptidase PulO-like enzyme (type II secretory pathway)